MRPLKYILDSIGVHAPVVTKIREKVPGNLGSYPFLKIHGYPVCLRIRIRFTKILSKRKTNFIVKLSST
jgi:hypothetical protein